VSDLFFRRRKRGRSSLVPATAPVAFDDSSDFHDEPLSDAGETFPSLASLPRVRSISSSSGPPWLSGLDLNSFSNALDLALVSSRVAWGAQRSAVRAALGSSSWREFNRLRLDPRTATCLRRSTRREVLFAAKRAGGGGISRKRRRSILSTIFC